MNNSAGLISSTASPTSPSPVTSPSLSSQASSLLHSFIMNSSNNHNDTGHPNPPVTPGLRLQDLQTSTPASPTSSLSPLTSSPSSGSPKQLADAVNVTTMSSATTANVTILRNNTADSHSLIPGQFGPDHENYLIHGVLLQTVLIVCLVALLFSVVYYLRKKHLDRLRHHLMPVYNFDPADDGEDWETELLDDQFVHCPVTDVPAQTGASGQLKLDTGLTRGLRVQNNNSSTASSGTVKSESSMSPNAMSGLLSSGSESGSHSSRRLYTSERDPVA